MPKDPFKHVAPGDPFPDGTMAPPILDLWGREVNVGRTVIFMRKGHGATSLGRGRVLKTYWLKPSVSWRGPSDPPYTAKIQVEVERPPRFGQCHPQQGRPSVPQPYGEPPETRSIDVDNFALVY